MIPNTLTQLRLRASGSLRWICCFVLIAMIVLRFWGTLEDNHEPMQESSLKMLESAEG